MTRNRVTMSEERRMAQTGKTGRQHKPAIRLSRVDAERLERGEIASPGEALRETETPRPQAAGAREVEARNAGEARILSERPPHFGKL